jgi:hypothetical protein
MRRARIGKAQLAMQWCTPRMACVTCAAAQRAETGQDGRFFSNLHGVSASIIEASS